MGYRCWGLGLEVNEVVVGGVMKVLEGRGRERGRGRGREREVEREGEGEI